MVCFFLESFFYYINLKKREDTFFFRGISVVVEFELAYRQYEKAQEIEIKKETKRLQTMRNIIMLYRILVIFVRNSSGLYKEYHHFFFQDKKGGKKETLDEQRGTVS